MNTHTEKTLGYLNHLYAKERMRFGSPRAGENDFEVWAASFRPVLRQMIGLEAIEESLCGFEPSVSLSSAEDMGDYTRRSGMLHSEPELDLPFWYLEPKSSALHPLALLPHGHYRENGHNIAVGIAADDETKDRIANEDRDVAVQAVRYGFAAIAPAARGFRPAGIPDLNERHGGQDCRSQLIHSLLAGRTVIGERVWDLTCLIDWAYAQRNIDRSNTLVMGNSGGGVTTLYASACDPRISIAVASCSYCSFVGGNGFIHHCDCNAVPGILTCGEFHDVAGLIAPRHLLTVNGRQDGLFPIDEVERAVDELRLIYQSSGASDRHDHRWGDGGHRFYRNLMWPFIIDAIGRHK